MKGKEKGQLYAKRDYAHYHFTGKEIMKYLLQAFMLCAAVDYLFYKSIWVLLLMSPLAMGYVSVPLEELFLDLGERSQVEDIENFASVFYTAKRTGGDMNKVIQKVTRMLGDKIDVKKEIEATLAAKKSEQMIMSLMPAGIIIYLQMTSPGFLNVLYGNPFGIAAMSVCLAIYITAYWMGRKIVDIEV